MTEEESLEAAIQEHVQIVPYDVAWPKRFETERARLHALFPDTFIAIEHFGRTRGRPSGITTPSPGNAPDR